MMALKQGDWVILKDLKKTEWNGWVGTIMNPFNAVKKRWPVVPCNPCGQKMDAVLIKPENLDPVRLQDMVKCVRLNAAGERMGVCSQFEMPCQHPMFKNTSPTGSSPFLRAIGHPMIIKNTEPVCRLVERADYDNQWATLFMIDLVTGFAPPEWQSKVGPMIMYRPDATDLTTADVACMNDFVNVLLDKYSEGTVVPNRDITPARYTRFCEGRCY